jgi:hypothetical protein
MSLIFTLRQAGIFFGNDPSALCRKCCTGCCTSAILCFTYPRLRRLCGTKRVPNRRLTTDNWRFSPLLTRKERLKYSCFSTNETFWESLQTVTRQAFPTGSHDLFN